MENEIGDNVLTEHISHLPVLRIAFYFLKIELGVRPQATVSDQDPSADKAL
jgi:hypothetical protein